VRLHSEAFGFGVAILTTLTGRGKTPSRIMPLLPKSMMRLGRFRARLTCLLLCFPDPRLLMSDLRTVWPDVFRDTTMKAGRLTSFVEMLHDSSANLRLAFSRITKSLPL
jgi:hypothetical protein